MKINTLAVSLILAIVGAINWGLVGLLGFDLVANLFGSFPLVARAIYMLVGASGVYLALIAKKIMV